MTKRLVSLIVSTAIFMTLFLPSEIFASDSYNVSVSVLDSDMNKITGKIPVGEDFYVTASVDAVSDNSLSFSVYCAVFNRDKMLVAYMGTNQEGTSAATAQCRIPESAGDDYYIKIFVWEDTRLSPLDNMIAFNASSPYETECAKDSMYTGRELLKDASFENDNMINEGWYARHSCRITRSADYVLDGSYSCKVSEREIYYDSVKQIITDSLYASGDGDYLIEYNILPVFESDDVSRNFSMISVMYDTDGNKTTPAKSKWDDLYIYNASNGTWNNGKAYVNFDVPENLYKAELYVESTTGNEDFYIDKCSLKKLLTHEEYLRDNIPEGYADSGENEYLEIIEAYNNANLVSVYPKNSDNVIKNPYKGLNYYTTKLDFSDIDLTKDGASCSKVVYHRLSWKTLEPEEGVYNFDVIEQNIEKLKQYDMMLGIGIGSCLTYNGYNSSTNAQGTPEWLFDTYEIPYTKQIVGDGSVPNSNVYVDGDGNQYLKVPVYNDPVFKEKMQRFLDAFAQRFNDNPDIAYVDMRNYGNWGEWHFSSFNDVIKNHSYYDEDGALQVYTTDDFKNLVDMFKNFRLPLAMFTSRTEMLNYALQEYNTGMRVDGTMNPHLSDEHRKLAYMDGKNFAVAEWFYQPEVYYEGGTYEAYADYMPVFMEKVVKEGKASYISMGYWRPEDFYSRFPDLVRRMANKTGYWLKPSRIAYPKNLTSGLFAMTVKNEGSAQLYAGYKRNACVKLALADSVGNILDTIILNGVDPEEWKAGKYSLVAENYSFDNTSGAAKLYLGIFSDADNQKPDIKLGIDASDINGWYDVTAIASNTYKSDNKLYTASYPYADYGYGYREPYYAFDNNADTYWASEIRKNEFLEIDFGEYMTVSEMMINAAQSFEADYSVIGFDGKGWISLYTGDGINQGENIFSLSEQKVSKVRLRFDESMTGTAKITEMYVD